MGRSDMELLGELTTQVRGWMENFQEKRNERPPDEYFMCLSPLYLLLGVVERFWRSLFGSVDSLVLGLSSGVLVLLCKLVTPATLISCTEPLMAFYKSWDNPLKKRTEEVLVLQYF